ncbi:MAG: hypothetical protein AB7D26_02940 [Marinobacterium sp.]|jgi:hypothetical protein
MNTRTDTAMDWLKPLLMALLMIGLLASFWLGARLIQESLSSGTHAQTVDCDLQQGPCQFELDGVLMQLEATPRPLRSLLPFELFLQVQGELDITQVNAELQGVEMYMGQNRFNLTAEPGKSNLWRGRSELAICTTGEMRWYLLLMLETATGQKQARFEFNAR